MAWKEEVCIWNNEINNALVFDNGWRRWNDKWYIYMIYEQNDNDIIIN